MIEDPPFTFYCSTCKSRVQAVPGGHVYLGEEGCEDRYAFGRCISCGQPALIVQSRTVIDINLWEDTRQIFPPATRAIDCKLPPKVEQAYQEALKCESAEAWLATAVMVRRTLEAVGREFDPSVRSPAAGLRTMKDKGIISEEMWNWGDELRFLGNIGAHPSDEEISAQDAKDALEFMGAIIETIYHLRPKFQAMKERRAKPRSTGKIEAA